jgi:protein O-mannosyl-transferase
MNKIARTKLGIAGLDALVAFAVFLPSLRNEFINWDDNKYVYGNSLIRSLNTQLVKSAFTRFHASNWHPLTWLSHAADYAMWGLNPLGHHLTNNLLHALNTLMVVLLVMTIMEVSRKTAGNDVLRNDRTIMITGAATGLLFGLHPLHVESVAWVAERKDLLCAFFSLFTMLVYTQYVSGITARGPTSSLSFLFNKKYLLAIGFCTLSLLSKPMAVSLPCVLLILDWYPFGRMQSLKAFGKASVEKLPFFALALISSILTLWAQKAGGAVISIERIPLTSRLIVAAQSLVAYLIKMLLPINLVPFYPYPEHIALSSLKYLVPIVIVIAITVTCVAVVKKQKLWMSVWSYYVITLLPVLGIVQVGSQSMADRYTYLPGLGVLFMTGFAFARVYDKAPALHRWSVTFRAGSVFVAMSMLVSLSYGTIMQIGVWKNSVVFWNYVIDKEPGRVPLAHNNLGEAYSAKRQFDMAIIQYQTALRLKPDYTDAHYNLGAAYTYSGRLDMAIAQYQAVLRLKPDHAKAHFNLGVIYLGNGSRDLAQREFEAVLTINPADYWSRQMLNSMRSR